MFALLNCQRSFNKKGWKGKKEKGKGRTAQEGGRKVFAEDQATVFCKAWIEKLGEGSNQKEKYIWKNVGLICREKYEIKSFDTSLRSN